MSLGSGRPAGRPSEFEWVLKKVRQLWRLSKKNAFLENVKKWPGNVPFVRGFGVQK